jgi:hypothetical protein
MKKTLLSFLFLASGFVVSAQTTFFSQDFETGTSVALPSGWTQITMATDTGWKVGNNATLQSNSFLIPAHTRFACTNDDHCNCNKSNDLLKTPAINLSTATGAFLSVDVFYNQGTYQGANELATIEVSTNSGTSWTVVDTLTGNSGWNTSLVNLNAYAGNASVMIGFRYNDGGGWLFGLAIDNVKVYQPNSLDLSVISQNLSCFLQKGTPYTLSGTLTNFGSTAISSLNLKYSVNGGAPISTVLSSLNIGSLTSYSFTSGTPWSPSVSGIASMKIWADNLNGSVDQNHSNDTLTATFNVVDSLQKKIPLFEEFNQASCDPCAQATPNLDSVLWNSRNVCSAVRYHVNWPGRDFMNKKTQGPFVASRVAFYGVNGVPDAKLDGNTDVYPGAGAPNSMTSPFIQQEALQGSPFKMSMVATYARSSRTYTVNATIKSYGTLPAGLIARCALTVDTITYHKNQSTETIPQTVFPQVAEEMLPGPNGTALAAFSSGQSQTLNLSWTTNHCWGDSISKWPYDSTLSTHFVMWVQDNSSKFVYQSVTATTTVVAGIEELTNLENLVIYPNPNNGDATISFQLKQEENVKINVYNAMGSLLRTVSKGNLPAGENKLNLDGQDLCSGMYFVSISIGDYQVTKKVSVIH